MPDDVRDEVDRDAAARCVLAVRRMLKETIATELAVNPAVDMLFALYLAHPDGKRVSKQQICEATDVAVDVCHRWGRALEQRGLVTIEDDDYRLSEAGLRVMSDVNDRVWRLAAEHFSSDLRPPA